MKFQLNKQAKSVIISYAIILVIYVLAFLLIPFTKNSASWVSFAFTVISIISSLLVCGYAFKDNKPLVSKLYGFPIFRVGVIYAIVQLVIGIIICVIDALNPVPAWIPLLLSVVLLGAAAIGVIITDNTRDIVEKVEEASKIETKAITCFQIDIAGIVDLCENQEVKPELEKLNELFKYSDPVTNDATKEIEEIINSMLTEFKIIVANENADDIRAFAKKLANTLNERNRICMANK